MAVSDGEPDRDAVKAEPESVVVGDAVPERELSSVQDIEPLAESDSSEVALPVDVRDLRVTVTES